jgi:Bacterial Ig-like domain (group 3)
LLTAGVHTIVALYPGDDNQTFALSMSNQLNQVVTVNPATLPTFVALSSSPNPAAVGQSALFTAVVAGTGGTPSGSVLFLDGGTSIGAGTLNGSGAATFGTASLSTGVHSITAQYLGDSRFVPANSATLNQTVGSDAGQISVQITPIPQNVAAGGSVQYTATLQNDTGNKGVTWQLNGPGALDSTGNYVAPASISSTTVTVTATSVADPAKKASVQFTVAADALTTTQPPASVPFTLSCGNLPLGSSCLFDPPAVTGQNPNFTFTVVTAGGSSAGLVLPQRMISPDLGPALLAVMVAGMLLFLLLLVRRHGSPVPMRPGFLVLALLCVSVACLVSCSGIPTTSSVQAPAAKAITPSGKYQVLVIATPQDTSGTFVQTQLIVPFTVQ